MSAHQIAAAFLNETSYRIDKSFQRIKYCLYQLENQDIWWRPNDQMNSAGNLILHINGNLRQWILHGVGGQEDIRDRPSEFDSWQTHTKKELVDLFDDLKTEIKQTLKKFYPEKILDERKIQGFDLPLLNAIYRTITHLEGHTRQIVYVTRMRKGDNYTLFWEPETEEQESKKGKRQPSHPSQTMLEQLPSSHVHFQFKLSVNN